MKWKLMECDMGAAKCIFDQSRASTGLRLGFFLVCARRSYRDAIALPSCIISLFSNIWQKPLVISLRAAVSTLRIICLGCSCIYFRVTEGVKSRTGCATWVRTKDHLINSQALYQLSYGARSSECVSVTSKYILLNPLEHATRARAIQILNWAP